MSRHKPSRAQIILIVLTIIVLGFFLGVMIYHLAQAHSDQSTVDDPTNSSTSSPTDSTPSPEQTPVATFINLQPVVDEWLQTTNRQVGLLIYDLDFERVAASYNASQVFNVASIYKLFYVYDGYRQIASGAENLDDYFVTTTDYRAGRHTIGECLDLAVRESYNGCADPLRSDAARSARVSQFIRELGLTETYNLGLSSTANDLTQLLRLYYYHTDLPAELWQLIADSMLNQPLTAVAPGVEYDWRQGLPSGFSSQVDVYDKVGWAWNGQNWTVYADAAIVDFPDLHRHYTVVVLTSSFDSYTPITNLGTLIEAAVRDGSELNP